MQPLLALLVTFGLMWALLIRPQQRRMRQHQSVVASLRAGDEIITAGGIYGRVRSVDDRSMIVEVAPGVELRVLRAAVSERVTEDEDEDEDDDYGEDEDFDTGFDTGEDTAEDTGEDTVRLEKDYGGSVNGEAGVAESTREEEQ